MASSSISLARDGCAEKLELAYAERTNYLVTGVRERKAHQSVSWTNQEFWER